MENNDSLENEAHALGLKIAIFINSLNLSIEQKEAFLEVLKSYSLAELEDLTNLLESFYLENKTDKSAAIKLRCALQKIKAADNLKSKNILQKSLGQFNAMEDFLSALS